MSQDLEKIKTQGRMDSLLSDFTDSDPFGISGNVGLNLRSYSAIGGENRQTPFMWFINGNVNLNIYKIKIPISAIVSAQTQTVSHPFSKETIDNFKDRKLTRIGASPYYKWAKLHLGHRSMNFSPLTLANHVFLGSGLELTPGNFRFATFYGGMAKTEPRDLALFSINTEVFNRRGFGVKTGYGTSKNFVDLILFKAKDNSGLEDALNVDSNYVYRNENSVLGINAQANIFKQISLRMELASSGFTNNINDPESLDGSRSLHNFQLDNRVSTTYRNAINTGLNFNGKLFSVGLGYKRIEPEYRSLGAYFFNNDLEDYTVNFNFALFDRKLQFNGFGGLQRNNLLGTKESQLSRTIANLNINYTLKSFSAGLNLSNYSSDVDFVLNPEMDSLNVIIITQNASLNTNYTFNSGGKGRNMLSFNVSLQNITDDVGDPTEDGQSQMLNSILSYRYSSKESNWKYNARLSYNQNELSGNPINRYGIGLGAGTSFLEKKLSVLVNSNFYYNDSENASNQTLNMKLSSRYKIDDHHGINLGVIYVNRLSKSLETQKDFSEFTTMLNYMYSF